MKQQEVRPSKIHGNGVFAVSGIKEGESIDEPYLYLSSQPFFGGYNHSCYPNSKILLEEIEGRPQYMGHVALRAISAGEEITVSYPQAQGYCNCGCSKRLGEAE